MKRAIILCGLLLASCGTPGAAYVQADFDTFSAIGVEYRGYVLADPILSQEQKDRRLLLVELWRTRITTAQGVTK